MLNINPHGFKTYYVKPAIESAKSFAKPGLGVTLAAVTALGAMFALQAIGLNSTQILVGGAIVGAAALTAYTGGAMLGSRSNKEKGSVARSTSDYMNLRNAREVSVDLDNQEVSVDPDNDKESVARSTSDYTHPRNERKISFDPDNDPDIYFSVAEFQEEAL